MNILIYSSNSHYMNKPVGGAEVSLRLIAEKFAELGDNVYYLSGITKKILYYKTKKINGVNVIFFNPIKWPSFKDKMFPSIKTKFSKFQYKKIIKYLVGKYEIDIVHTYNEYPNTYDVLKVKEKYNLNFKTIIRVSGLIWRNKIIENKKMKKTIEWIYNNIDEINYVSKGLKILFAEEARKIELNNYISKNVVMDIGFNDIVFKGKWEYKEEGKFIIVMVARFANYAKRQDLLAKAFKYLGDDYELHFIGDGIERKKIEKYIQDEKLINVVFHGYIDQEKIQEILLNSSLFVMITEYEGSCKGVIEAMSMGVPVLCSNVLALSKDVEEGYNGFLVENEPHSIANKIKMIKNMKDKVIKISENEIKYINKNFDPNKNIKKYKKVFEDLIND